MNTPATTRTHGNDPIALHIYKNSSDQNKAEQEQDKRGPQAIYIGFDDNKMQDPFSKKPALRKRDNDVQLVPKSNKYALVNRSKSTKGIANSSRAKRTAVIKQHVSLNGDSSDKQLRSPVNK